MTAKKQRQQDIRQLIGQQSVATQHELLALLRQKDSFVTQTTVSRDLHELGALKVADSSCTYFYKLPDVYADFSQDTVCRLLDAYEDCILGVRHQGDLVFLRTRYAAGKAIGKLLRMLEQKTVLGVIAAGNAVTVVAGSPAAAMMIYSRLMEIVQHKYHTE